MAIASCHFTDGWPGTTPDAVGRGEIMGFVRNGEVVLRYSVEGRDDAPALSEALEP